MQQNRDRCNRVPSLVFLTLLPPFFTPPFSSRFSSRTRAAGCLGTRDDDLGVVINDAGGLKCKKKSIIWIHIQHQLIKTKLLFTSLPKCLNHCKYYNINFSFQFLFEFFLVLHCDNNSNHPMSLYEDIRSHLPSFHHNCCAWFLNI